MKQLDLELSKLKGLFGGKDIEIEEWKKKCTLLN